MIENVTLHDVQLAEVGLDIYNATNVQFTGNTNVGKVTTCNTLAITEQPKDAVAAIGGAAAFNVMAVGASGVADTPRPLSVESEWEAGEGWGDGGWDGGGRCDDDGVDVDGGEVGSGGEVYGDGEQ